jgi:hypothetical protein
MLKKIDQLIVRAAVPVSRAAKSIEARTAPASPAGAVVFWGGS